MRLGIKEDHSTVRLMTHVLKYKIHNKRMAKKHHGEGEETAPVKLLVETT